MFNWSKPRCCHKLQSTAIDTASSRHERQRQSSEASVCMSLAAMARSMRLTCADDIWSRYSGLSAPPSRRPLPMYPPPSSALTHTHVFALENAYRTAVCSCSTLPRPHLSAIYPARTVVSAFPLMGGEKRMHWQSPPCHRVSTALSTTDRSKQAGKDE